MQTMFEYIESQDQDFSQKPFTDADAAILSTVANIDLSYFYDKRGQKKVSLKTLAEDFMKSCCDSQKPTQECILFEKIIKSPRYGDILISDAVSEIDKNSVKQFGALVFWPSEDLAYVSYAGTGTSIVGYREDMHMCFKDIVPSQEDAVRFLNALEEDLPEDIIVGGFSKGGNLAVFASAFCKPEIRERIETVYNHDGPGFSELIQHEKKYTTLQPLVKSYIPQASIVGHILEEGRDYKIIESTNLPIAQHQPYSWIFEDDDLKVIDQLSSTSNFFIRMQRRLLDSIPSEDREDLVDSIFEIISDVDSDDFMVFAEQGTKIIPALRDAWKNSNKETKKNVRSLLKQLSKTFIQSIELKKS